MDSCPPEWNTEVGAEFPLYVQRRQLGLENELVELLWQNGEIVLNSQNNRKQGYGHSRSKLIQSTVRDQNNLIEDVDTASWIDCPIDESFEKEFCSNFLSEIPPFDPVESNKKVEKVGPSEVNHVAGRQDFAPPPPLPPPPRFQTDATHQHQIPRGGVPEGSIRTVGSSHCASNQVVNEVDMSWASSCGIGSRTFSLGGDETYGQKVNERESLDQAMPSCSGGSASSSFWKTNSQSNDSSRPKRKNRDVEESECPSDAMDSAPGSKPSQKPGMARRSRVAEVHNQSERRRRDRINEKMKALQELIPNSNKSDKASMLDEAIEYMKSLQLQIQLMWMGRGMAPMMLPGMQHYMSRIGMGIGPPMLPAIQNLMRLTRLPGVDQAITMAPTTSLAPVGHNPLLGQVNYQNQMQNANFPEQYANLMGFHSIPNTSQPTNMPNYGFHLTQQNAVRAPRGNGSIG